MGGRELHLWSPNNDREKGVNIPLPYFDCTLLNWIMFYVVFWSTKYTKFSNEAFCLAHC